MKNPIIQVKFMMAEKEIAIDREDKKEKSHSRWYKLTEKREQKLVPFLYFVGYGLTSKVYGIKKG